MIEDITNKISILQKNLPTSIQAGAIMFGIYPMMNSDLPENISGEIKVEEDGSVFAYTNKNEHEFRQRFTLAHLIGDFILHKSIIMENKGSVKSLYYDDESKKITSLMKAQSNSFAANLLVPKEHLKLLIENQDNKASLDKLCQYFCVTPSVIKWQIKQCNINVELAETEIA